jgi:hypothetical protein
MTAGRSGVPEFYRSGVPEFYRSVVPEFYKQNITLPLV